MNDFFIIRAKCMACGNPVVQELQVSVDLDNMQRPKWWAGCKNAILCRERRLKVERQGSQARRDNPVLSEDDNR